MSKILCEYAHEVKRNVHEVKEFYKDCLICAPFSYGIPVGGFGTLCLLILSPAVYLTGVLEPVPEVAIRGLLGRYSLDSEPEKPS